MLGIPYRTSLVDRKARAQKSADYLALNPNGLIPVLETPQGPMFETGAILLWLADTSGQMIPPADDPARAHAVQWLFWLSNTLHPTLRMLFYPDQYLPGDPAKFLQASAHRARTQLDMLDTAPHADWLDGSAPSIQACYLAPMLRWAALYGSAPNWFDLDRWPRLLAFAQRFEMHDAVTRAALAEGLGQTPFSAPSHCNPPEGSAT